jgi:hypothetical protein
LGALSGHHAFAADSYVQPRLELRAESSSNLELDAVTDEQSDTQGAVAELGALVGIATPRSETTLRPMVRLQEYSDREDYEKVEAFLDFSSVYESERSEFSLVGKYSWQNNINAERSSAGFDEIDPDDPSAPETTAGQAGSTRQRFDLRPTFSRRLTERTSIGAAVAFQGVRYSDEDDSTQVEYDFTQGGTFVRWALDPRSDLTFGAYASEYDSRQGSSQVDTVGGSLGFRRDWSERATTSLEVNYEQNDTTADSVSEEERTNDWGASFTTAYSGDVDQWRLTAARTYAPNGRGGKSSFDQFRLQYDRDLSERLQFTGAARYVKDEAIDDAGSADDRELALFGITLTWRVTARWFIRGGYQYLFQDKSSEPDKADDNRIMLGIGYQGLGRDTRR